MTAGIQYPETRTEDVVDHYHGTAVHDPYRWLEDSASTEVQEWVARQNEITRRWLEEWPGRPALARRLRQLWDFPRVGVPTRRGDRIFFQRNEGLQDQPVLLVVDGPGRPPRPLLDPNRLSQDGTVALTNLAVSEDGDLVAYGLSDAGSDWQEVRVRETEGGVDRPDVLRWVRFTSLAWTRDGAGLFYSRYDDPATVPAGRAHLFQKLYYHRLGEPQERDRLIYERPEDGLLGMAPEVTDDGRFLLVHVFRGTDKNHEVFLRRLDDPTAEFLPLAQGFDAAWQFLGARGEELFFRTDLGAPRGKIVARHLGREDGWRTVVPESQEVLDFGGLAAGHLVVVSLRNAHHRVRVHRLDGSPETEIPLPSMGSITGLGCRVDQEDLFLGFTSFVHPGSVHRYDLGAGRLEPFEPAPLPFEPDSFEVRQEWYPSADGTRVPMFLVGRVGLPRDGRRPVRLYGYGGFMVNLTPAFSPSNVVWLEQGGLLAYPNLRGGGEFGEAWHAAGMLHRKQTVFDDFQAAAAWLIREGFTSPGRLGIQGGSNGGLLTGACLVQAPERFGAVVSQVPVLDMLRYQHWTIGRYWAPEYGTAEDADQFRTLLAYSPYHNLVPRAYPPTLVTTGDGDDRVHPAHARKFAARLQSCNRSGSPTLLRVERRAGHGAGKPTGLLLDEAADVLTFLFRALEVPPEGPEGEAAG